MDEYGCAIVDLLTRLAAVLCVIALAIISQISDTAAEYAKIPVLLQLVTVAINHDRMSTYHVRKLHH